LTVLFQSQPLEIIRSNYKS